MLQAEGYRRQAEVWDQLFPGDWAGQAPGHGSDNQTNLQRNPEKGLEKPARRRNAPQPASRPASRPCTSSRAQQGGETPGTPAEFLREATLGRAAPGTEPNPIWAQNDPRFLPAPGTALDAQHTALRAPSPHLHPGTSSASLPKGQGSQESTVPRHPRRPQPRRGLCFPLRPPTKLGASTAGPRAPAPPSPGPCTGSARPRPAHSPAPAPGWAHRRLPARIRVHTRGTRQKGGPRRERARWTELEARPGGAEGGAPNLQDPGGRRRRRSAEPSGGTKRSRDGAARFLGVG